MSSTTTTTRTTTNMPTTTTRTTSATTTRSRRRSGSRSAIVLLALLFCGYLGWMTLLDDNNNNDIVHGLGRDNLDIFHLGTLMDPSLSSSISSQSSSKMQKQRRHLQEDDDTANIVTSLVLVNTNTNEPVMEIENDSIIFISSIPDMIYTRPAFNINATISSSATNTDEIGSVVFTYTTTTTTTDKNRDEDDTTTLTIMENAPPYALCGNNNKNNKRLKRCRGPFLVTLGPNLIIVTATAYSRPNGQGRTLGNTLQRTFQLYATNQTNYTLPELLYPYEGLEPYIDEATMRLHHDKHHLTATTNLNNATSNTTTYKVPIDVLIADANVVNNNKAIRNNGGSHYNHGLFWDIMIPYEQAKDMQPSPQLQSLIDTSFGNFDTMKAQFNTTATTLFGSGWAWLCVNATFNGLSIIGTPNQDNPLTRGVVSSVTTTGADNNKKVVMYPILGLDVWEHSYYLRYNNRRTEYIAAWWNVVNWDQVSANCAHVVANRTGVMVRG